MAESEPLSSVGAGRSRVPAELEQTQGDHQEHEYGKENDAPAFLVLPKPGYGTGQEGRLRLTGVHQTVRLSCRLGGSSARLKISSISETTLYPSLAVTGGGPPVITASRN